MIGLALVVALEAHPPAAGATAVTIVTTAVAVGLAELYSELVGARVRLRGPCRRSTGARSPPTSSRSWPAPAFPAVFFLLAAVACWSSTRRSRSPSGAGLGLIALYGFWAARLGGASHGRSLVHAGAVALIGAFVIALKALVH